MVIWITLSAITMLLLSFASLGSKLFNRYISYYSIQSLILTFTCSLLAYRLHLTDLWILASLTLVIKTIAIPFFSHHWLLKHLEIKRDTATNLGPSTSLILGAVLVALGLLLNLPESPDLSGIIQSSHISQSVPQLAIAIIFIGGLCMVIRKHIVAQLFGWLMVENGVFLLAITLVPTFAFIVEAGIFLDLVGAVLITVALAWGFSIQKIIPSASELKGLKH